MALITILALGFVLGIRHATDADHVVAVTTIISRERSVRSAAFLGSLWGVGHTLTILLVGGAIVMFNVVIPPRVGLSMEMAVAAMLMVLGALNLSGLMERIDRAAHDFQIDPISPDTHRAFDGTEGRRHLGSELSTARVVRSVLVGVVHGLAGSAAVALLVLSSIHDPRWALLYLAVFGGGTVMGMMLITVAMVVPLSLAADRVKAFPQLMARMTGLLSLVFGVFLAYRIGVVDGLFGANPTWVPG